MNIRFALCILLFSIDAILCDDAIVALAKKWAPKIYLNSKEEFWPGAVDDFLTQVTPEGPHCPSGPGIPKGPESKNCFLTTNGKPKDLLKGKNSYLYGVKPSVGKVSVPAYAHVKNCGGDHVIISYWIFFPFNYGKDICHLLGNIPLLSSLCSGDKKEVLGNHIGDWEHLSIEFQDGEPITTFLSVHDGGIYYKYDKASNTFTMDHQAKGGILKIPDPPGTILVDDTHPLLYSAAGSHAVWSAEGSFSYSRPKLKDLKDITDKGPEWDTWEELQVFDSDETTPGWWWYEGRWGNKGSQCILHVYCIFSSGPVGLSIRPDDFQCEPSESQRLSCR